MEEIGRELRARRTAAGRTVASVASDAGLSVPYVANLENGRGNPTLTALTRLAAALGTRLEISFAHNDESGSPATADSPPVPPSLVRLGRTARFRRTAAVIARSTGREPNELSTQLVAARLVTALATLAGTLGADPGEADWWRLLDALLLMAEHPALRD
jgi:transcriptional regulator with XRE-family HTH domain